MNMVLLAKKLMVLFVGDYVATVKVVVVYTTVIMAITELKLSLLLLLSCNNNSFLKILLL